MENVIFFFLMLWLQIFCLAAGAAEQMHSLLAGLELPCGVLSKTRKNLIYIYCYLTTFIESKQIKSKCVSILINVFLNLNVHSYSITAICSKSLLKLQTPLLADKIIFENISNLPQLEISATTFQLRAVVREDFTSHLTF